MKNIIKFHQQNLPCFNNYILIEANDQQWSDYNYMATR